MSKRKRRAGHEVDPAAIEASLESGGVAIVEEGGVPLHVAPPEIANSLRFFLSRLWQSDEGGVPPTIAVTAALSGEGVTYVARSLAAVIAHDLDRGVCVVETNWWSQATSSTIDRRTGLADVLAGRCTLDEALVRTTEERLVMLTSGELPVAARPAAVASSAFTDLLKLLSKVFDAVIIDTPPILKVAQATAIARHADASILAVRQGVTTERQLAAAIDELSGTELGVIVNCASTRVPKVLRRFMPHS